MDHRRMRTVLIAALMLTAPLVAQKQNGRSVVSDVKELSKGIDKFSYSLLFRLASDLTDSNIVISPFSVWTTMAIVSEGSNGMTRDEALQSLGYPANPNLPEQSSRLSTVFDNIAPYFNVNTTTVQLETINSIFYKHTTSIHKNYEQLVRNVYKTEFNPLNFAEEDSADKINRYITQATHNRITKIVSKGDLDKIVMIITNAVFFKGQWTYPFSASSTEKDVPFYDSHNKEIGRVNMMNQLSDFPYINMKSINSHIIELPYGQENDNRLSMIVILPKKNVSVMDVIEGLSRVPIADIFTALDEAYRRYRGSEIYVSLPRFSVTSDINMNQALIDMGIRKMFDSRYADLSKISEQELYLSKVIHKAQIEVTEEGTVASAVTDAEGGNRIIPPNFVANKPFIYLIVEKSTNLLLIGGIYAKPSLF